MSNEWTPRKRRPSARAARRTELFARLEHMLGDDVIAGTKIAWKDVAKAMKTVRTPELISLAYRIERAIAEAAKAAELLDQTEMS